jgi:hypothetical protein
MTPFSTYAYDLHVKSVIVKPDSVSPLQNGKKAKIAFTVVSETSKSVKNVSYEIRIINNKNMLGDRNNPVLLKGKIKSLKGNKTENQETTVAIPYSPKKVLKNLPEGSYEIGVYVDGKLESELASLVVKRPQLKTTNKSIDYIFDVPKDTYIVTDQNYGSLGVTSRVYSTNNKVAFIFQYPLMEIGNNMTKIIQEDTTRWGKEPINIIVRQYIKDGRSLDSGFVDFIHKDSDSSKSFRFFVYYDNGKNFLAVEDAKIFGKDLLQKLSRSN